MISYDKNLLCKDDKMHNLSLNTFLNTRFIVRVHAQLKLWIDFDYNVCHVLYFTLAQKYGLILFTNNVLS